MKAFGRVIVLSASLAAMSAPAGSARAQAQEASQSAASPGAEAKDKVSASPEAGRGAVTYEPPPAHKPRTRRGGKRSKASDPGVMKKKNVTGVSRVKGVHQPVQKAP